MTGRSSLIGESRAVLRERGLEPLEVLVANDWKRTVTWRTKGGGTTRTSVAKWIGSATPERIRRGFEAEASFYRRWSAELPAPRPLAIEPDLIVLEDLGGRSLRAVLVEAMRSSDEAAFAIIGETGRRVLETVATWTARGREGSIGTAAWSTFDDAVLVIRSSLARSGPMATRRSRPAAALGRTLDRVTRRPFGRALTAILAAEPEMAAVGLAHGDLHLDNLLAGDDGRVVLVDFATASPSGMLALDPAYALAAGLVLLSPRPTLREALLESAGEAFRPLGPLGEAVERLAVLLEPMGRQNPRFNSEAGAGRLLGERLRLAGSLMPRTGRRQPRARV